MTHPARTRPKRLALLPFLVVTLLFSALGTSVAVADIVPNPDPDLIAEWHPCEPDTGVTIIVDRNDRLGDGKIYVRCALGAQPNGVAALQNAGFVLEGTQDWGLAFICRIDGQPSPEQESCTTTPGADQYWSYWNGKPGGQWGYSGVGAANPLSAAAINSVQGWGFGRSPRIQPEDGRGPSAVTLPDPQPSSVAPAALARDWLNDIAVQTSNEVLDDTLQATSTTSDTLMQQAIVLGRAGATPDDLTPVADLLSRPCAVDGEQVAACQMWLYVNSTRTQSGWDHSSPEYQQALLKTSYPERYAEAVLAIAALGKDPSNFGGIDVRGELLNLIDPATGQLLRQNKLTDAPDYAGPALEALADTGTLPEQAIKTIGVVLSKQNATTGAFTVSTMSHVSAIRGLVAARDAGAQVDGLDDALNRAGAFLESIQQDDGAVRQRASTSASYNPTLESTADGAIGLALTGRQAAAERAAKWVSRYQITAEYAGSADPDTGTQSPAYPLIGAFLATEGAYRDAINNGVPSSSAGLFTSAQAPTTQALDALTVAGPYGPLYAALDQQSLLFAKQTVGSQSSPQAVTLTSHDPRDVTIAGANVAGEQGSDFAVDLGECAGRTLSDGESCELSVRFAPTTAGTIQAVAQIALAGDEQTLDLAISGEAVAKPDGPDTDAPDRGPDTNPGHEPQPGPQHHEPSPQPQPQPEPGPKRPSTTPVIEVGTIKALKHTQTVSSKRLAAVASLSCPKGGSSCTVTVPKHIKVTIGGKRYTLTVLASKTVKAGKKATLRVRLSKAAATRLQGRKATVKVKVTITTAGKKATRTINVTIKGKAAKKASHRTR